MHTSALFSTTTTSLLWAAAVVQAVVGAAAATHRLAGARWLVDSTNTQRKEGETDKALWAEGKGSVCVFVFIWGLSAALPRGVCMFML